MTIEETKQDNAIEEISIENKINDKEMPLLKRASLSLFLLVVFYILYISDNNAPFNPVGSDLFMSLALITAIVSIVSLIKLLPFINKKGINFLYNVLEYLVMLPIIMVLITIINAFFLSFSPISGTSMEPNYHDKEAVLFSHLNKDYERFDVIILRVDTLNEPYLIKRVIGLPGETVVIDHNEIYIDGALLMQDFIDTEKVKTYCVSSTDINYCEFTVPEDSYFVLGDNRDGNGIDEPSGYSIDSRVFGPVSKEDTYGKVVYHIANIPVFD